MTHDQNGQRRSPDPAVAGQRMMQQIAAARKARQRHMALSLVGAMSALTLLVSGSAFALARYVSSGFGLIDAGTSGTPPSGPVNILVAGIDTRSGLSRRQETRLHVGNVVSANSDTLMLVHIPADHASVQVVSLPRDSWVSIPGHGMNKINAAYGLGGPRLMVRTVERATGLVVNDYIEVDFLGLVKVINALGGVNICVPYAVDDPYSGLDMSPGKHHVDGAIALEFARDRHSFAQSDLARISDQQQLLSSVFAEATAAGVIADPVRLQQFLSSVTAAVKVDRGFDLVRLAQQMRGIRPSDVAFTTVPLSSVNYTTPTGESAVRWNTARADALFSWLQQDTRTTRLRLPQTSPLTRAMVSLNVYNGTQLSGLSAETGKLLRGLGFRVRRASLSWPADDVAQTVIQYPPGRAAAAKLLAQVLPGATMQAVSGLSRIRLILGASGHTVSGKPETAPADAAAARASAADAAPAQPAPGVERTAEQDACR